MLNDKQILIIDTDEELLQALHDLFSSRGYSVRTTLSPSEAIDICRKEMPGLIILEGLLPKINGIDLARKIRALSGGEEVGLILMSAIYSGAKFKKPIEEAGIHQVIKKPFQQRELLEKIQDVKLQLEILPTPSSSVEHKNFSFSGSISEIPFIRMVYHLCTDKQTGTLRLEHGSTKKLVTFDQGEPRFVVSNVESECLGQLLVKKGRLTAEECQRSIEMMKQLKKRQGESLIQLGLLEPYELDEMLKQQAREKFCEIFAWRDGKYVFVPGRVFRKELTPVDLSIPQLCLRGIKEHYNLSTLQTELAPYLRSKPVLVEKGLFKLEDYKLANWDLKIIHPVRQGKSLLQILEMRVARDIDVYHLFFTLFMLGNLGMKPTR